MANEIESGRLPQGAVSRSTPATLALPQPLSALLAAQVNLELATAAIFVLQAPSRWTRCWPPCRSRCIDFDRTFCMCSIRWMELLLPCSAVCFAYVCMSLWWPLCLAGPCASPAGRNLFLSVQ